MLTFRTILAEIHSGRDPDRETPKPFAEFGAVVCTETREVEPGGTYLEQVRDIAKSYGRPRWRKGEQRAMAEALGVAPRSVRRWLQSPADVEYRNVERTTPKAKAAITRLWKERLGAAVREWHPVDLETAVHTIGFIFAKFGRGWSEEEERMVGVRSDRGWRGTHDIDYDSEDMEPIERDEVRESTQGDGSLDYVFRYAVFFQKGHKPIGGVRRVRLLSGRVVNGYDERWFRVKEQELCRRGEADRKLDNTTGGLVPCGGGSA